MANDIKDLINSIIDKTDNSYPSTGDGNTSNVNPTLSFDRGEFRNKLSMSVLHDIISAMMNDDTKDVDCMIDKSITDHLNKYYGGSPYDYLCRCRDKCNVGKNPSRLLGDIIQEIDDAADEATKQVHLTKDDSNISADIDVLDLEKNIDNYAQFRAAIKRKVANKIINNVKNEILGSNEAPTFKDTLDDELAGKNNEGSEMKNAPTSLEAPAPEGELPANVEENKQPVGESSIISAMTTIISESYLAGNPIDKGIAMEQAIIEYCIAEMDFCFKQFDQAGDFHNKYVK